MNAEIVHHRARDGVTGSCHQLFFGSHSLLIDCGLFQGAETSPDGRTAADRLEIAFEVDSVRALVLTHVHIDHCGRIPWLLAAGFRGPILCSEPSARLLPVVLADAFALGVTRERTLIERMRHLPRVVRLVHGERAVREDFADHLRAATAGRVEVIV